MAAASTCLERSNRASIDVRVTDDVTHGGETRDRKQIRSKRREASIAFTMQWSHKWGFKISVTKSQVICFAKKHKNIVIKLNDQELEQALRICSAAFKSSPVAALQ